MKFLNLTMKILFVMSVSASVILSAFLFYLTSQRPTNNTVSAPVKKPIVSMTHEREVRSLPIRLKIPSINIDAFIGEVGITNEGTMGVPKDPDEVVWFNLGPCPGDVGSAVISGHYGWKNGTPAIFDNLYKLKKGDKISVENEKGEVVVFVVRESKRYTATIDAKDVFYSNDGKAHLNIVTCEGLWNATLQSYSKRLVVFADKEGD